VTNYYEILSIGPTAAPGEIKRAFRAEIARYHPDKVQHLGREFQEMAATRAAQLTEAYRILMNAELRAEYDLRLQVQPPAAPPPAGEAPPPARPARTAESAAEPAPHPASPASSLFAEERSSRDVLVRQATMGRLRQIVGAGLAASREVPVRGFDLAYAPAKMRIFGKGRPAPNCFVRIVRHVDRAAIRETWAMAQKVLAGQTGEACVLLLGPVTSARDAGAEVAALQRQPGPKGRSLLLLPVDNRDWSVTLPADTPRLWRLILERLKKAG
jgi:hypothetical protein